MAIIRNVQQKLTAGLILDPTMKDRNQSLEVDFLRILHEELYVDVLKFHGVDSAPLSDGDSSQPVVTGVRGVNKQLGLINQEARRVRTDRFAR